MAYIEMTNEMVQGARDKLQELSGAELHLYEVKAALDVAMRIGQIRSDPEPAAELTSVRLSFRTADGDVEYRTAQLGQDNPFHEGELAKITDIMVTKR
jgi:hypothetical protein